MVKTADISKTRYEELKKNPVFFLKFFENIHYDNNETSAKPSFIEKFPFSCV